MPVPIQFLPCLLHQLPRFFDGLAGIGMCGVHFLAGERLRAVIDADHHPLAGADPRPGELRGPRILGAHAEFEDL